jgi:putative redox protein
MNANVTWNQGMSFTGSAESGFKVLLDGGTDLGDNNEGFRPLELMAISLAGCTAMDVISILEKKQQAVTAFEVKVQAERADQHPKIFTRVVITYMVTGHAVDESAVARSIELSATKYCPAQAMLGKIMPIDLLYDIYEETNGDVPKLVKQGKYQPQEK